MSYSDESSNLGNNNTGIFSIISPSFLHNTADGYNGSTVDNRANSSDYANFLLKTGRVWPNFNELNVWGITNCSQTPDLELSAINLQNNMSTGISTDIGNYNGAKIVNITAKKKLFRAYFNPQYFPIELSYFNVDGKQFKEIILKINQLPKLKYYSLIHNKWIRVLTFGIIWILLILCGIISNSKLEDTTTIDIILVILLLNAGLLPIVTGLVWMLTCKKFNHQAYRVLNVVNGALSKQNILCGVHDSNLCESNAISLSFMYFQLLDCKKELTFQLQFTDLIKRNLSKTMKIYYEEMNRTTVTPISIPNHQMCHSDQYAAKISEVLLLNLSSKYINRFLKNELPIPKIALHSKLGVQCLCQFISTEHFYMN